MADILKIRPAADVKWDCLSFGEVMLRFDPGFGRVRKPPDTGLRRHPHYRRDPAAG